MAPMDIWVQHQAGILQLSDEWWQAAAAHVHALMRQEMRGLHKMSES